MQSKLTCEDGQGLIIMPFTDPPQMSVRCYACFKSMTIDLPKTIQYVIGDPVFQENIEYLVNEWGKIHICGNIEFVGKTLKKGKVVSE